MPHTQTYQLVECSHCGTPFRPRAAERFCCHGCQYVYQMIRDGGLERFYELKGEDALPPVGSKVFDTTNFDWLLELQQQAESSASGEVCHTKLGVEGISCIACVWLIESIYQSIEGSQEIRIDPKEGHLNLHWTAGADTLHSFAERLQQIGYKIVPENGKRAQLNQSKWLVSRIGLCAFFLMNTMLFTLPGYLGMGGDFFLAPLFQLLGAGFATLSLLVGGGYFIARAWQALKQRVLHIDLPIALGLLAAYAGSLLGWVTGYATLIYFDFVATFVFLMLVGRWLQEVALEQNRSHLHKQDFGPDHVTLIGGARDGARVPVEEIEVGQSYSIAPGAVNPVAADLDDRNAHVSLEWINGESEPTEWSHERILPAGIINVGLESIRCTAREHWSQSLLAQLLNRPEDSFQNQRLQRVLKCYIGAVLLIAIIGSWVWLMSTGNLLKSAQVLISVLIVSCPCALGIALPMCDEFATAGLRRAGLFVKSADIWERLRQVRTVVFDKTGTLTMDTPRLKNPEALIELDPLASVALYQMVQHNAHPVARTLRETLITRKGKHSLQGDAASSIHEVIGSGVHYTDTAGNQWTLGKADWLPDAHTPAEEPNARTVLRQNGHLIASFDFEEDVRDDALDAIRAFRHGGLNTALLSGDSSQRVHRIAQSLELDQAHTRAECTPQDKAEWIHHHAKNCALMIGDGANDSLAFDAAICRGTPVIDRSILEASADFFFFGRSLRCLPLLWQTAEKRRRVVTTIFAVAISYNLFAISLCLSGHMHPLLAAILMPLSSIATLALSWIGLGGSSRTETLVKS